MWYSGTPAQTTSTTSFSGREHTEKHNIQHVYEENTRSTRTNKTQLHADKRRSEDTIPITEILIDKK
jgi:hypothetical protein